MTLSYQDLFVCALALFVNYSTVVRRSNSLRLFNNLTVVCLGQMMSNLSVFELQDAMETAAQSGETSIAEELLQFFVERKERECFAAMLYTCYDLVKPDQALELAWTNGLVDFVMPYMIQYLKDYTGKVYHIFQSS